jgi:hypothetical protein
MFRPTVDGDQMLEPELTGEAVGAAEGLAGERGKTVDVQGIAGTEEGL